MERLERIWCLLLLLLLRLLLLLEKLIKNRVARLVPLKFYDGNNLASFCPQSTRVIYSANTTMDEFALFQQPAPTHRTYTIFSQHHLSVHPLVPKSRKFAIYILIFGRSHGPTHTNTHIRRTERTRAIVVWMYAICIRTKLMGQTRHFQRRFIVVHGFSWQSTLLEPPTSYIIHFAMAMSNTLGITATGFYYRQQSVMANESLPQRAIGHFFLSLSLYYYAEQDSGAMNPPHIHTTI